MTEPIYDTMSATWAYLRTNIGNYLVDVVSHHDVAEGTCLVCRAVLEYHSNISMNPQGQIAQHTFAMPFDQCLHPVNGGIRLVVSAIVLVWLRDMHENDRRIYVDLIKQAEKINNTMRAARSNLVLPGRT